MKGAGILFLDRDKNGLFLKRGAGGDFPGYWCFAGGTTEAGETPEETAVREAREELGEYPSGTLFHLTETVSDKGPLATDGNGVPLPGQPASGESVVFTTFIQKVEDQFTPKLNGEHVGYAWAPVSAPPEPLHPGCAAAIARMSMNELGIARAIAGGSLPSPQRYKNVWLFALRITGTGMAYRNGLKEFVWRSPEAYLNQDFLDRANGLSVIFQHPEKKPVLDSQEFNDRVIGSIMLPYIKGDEVWGVAKLYDDSAIKLMLANQLSTSPGVSVSTDDAKIKLESGKVLLIENEPTLLDHLAVCQQGVWDKDGEPTGVDITARGDSAMAGEDKDKKDASGIPAMDAVKDEPKNDEKLDMLLRGIDSLQGGIKALNDRADASDKRMDSMMTDKKDAAEPKEVIADKKDEDDKDKKDADDKEKAKDDKKDEDDKDKKDARMDSVDVAALVARTAELEKSLGEVRRSIPRSLNDADHDAMVGAQSRADSVMMLLGERAARPMDGETPVAYRLRLAKTLQKHSPSWEKSELADFAKQDSAFVQVENQIYLEAAAAARSPATVPAGTLRTIRRQDDTGRTITEFVGSPKAWMAPFTLTPKKLGRISNGSGRPN